MKSGRSVKVLCASAGAVVLAFVAFCGFQIPKLDTRYSVRQFFPKDHPILKTDEKIDRLFHLRSSPSFFATLDVGGPGTWLEPSRMAVLRKVTDEIAAMKDVKEVLSLANAPMAVSRKDELRIGTLAETTPPAQWMSSVASQPLVEQLVSKDRRSVLLVIEPKTGSSAGLAKLERKIDHVLRSQKGYKSGLAGVPAVQSRLSEILQEEVGLFFLLSLVIFCLMFAVFYRNLSPVLFALGGLVVCNVTALGLLSFFGVSFNVLLSTLPIIVSIAFASMTIHTLHLWADRLKAARPNMSPLKRWLLAKNTLKEIAMANFLGSVTTAIGFAALVSAPIPAIRQYALVVAGSVMWVFVLTQFCMFFVLPWIAPVQRDWSRRRAWWMVGVNRWSGPIFVATIGACVFMGGAGVKLNFSSRLFDDLPANERVSRSMMAIDRDFGGTVNLDLTLDAGKKNAWSDPKALARLNQAVADIRRLEGVGAVIGFTDFFGAKMPASRGAAAEMMFLFSMAEENPLRHFVDNSLRRTRVSLRLRDLPTAKIERLRADARAILSKNFPKASIVETGLAVNSHTINGEVAKGLVFGFWHSLLVIGLLLTLIFRSLRWALVACVPNLVPPAVLIGALAFYQTPVKPAIALIFSIALGLAFNNTVYFLTRLRNLRNAKRMTRTLPLRRAMLEEGNPCLSESALTLAGFLIFLSSGFGLNQTFGVYMCLSIVAGALGDLVFLPALLKLFPELLGYGPKREVAGLLQAPPVETLVPRAESSPAKKIAAAVAGLIFVIFGSSQARADESAELLKKARANIESKSDQATVTLKIIEANGDSKTRKLTLKTLRSGGSFYALARLLAPADIKGTALLAEVKDGSQNQWLYLPSSKQVRRIVSGKKSAGVLGSELSPDDLDAAAIKGAKTRLVRKDGKTAEVEVIPNKGASEYSRVVLTFAMPRVLPVRTDYYVGSKPRKTVEFKDYAVAGGKTYRARKIVVKNLANRRATEVELSDLKVNAALTADDFSVGALKRAD